MVSDIGGSPLLAFRGFLDRPGLTHAYICASLIQFDLMQVMFRRIGGQISTLSLDMIGGRMLKFKR